MPEAVVPRSGTGYLPELDGLRCFAFLAVDYHHAVGIFDFPGRLFAEPPWFGRHHRVATLGAFGVDLAARRCRSRRPSLPAPEQG